jgi:hypothetical protein
MRVDNDLLALALQALSILFAAGQFLIALTDKRRRKRKSRRKLKE